MEYQRMYYLLFNAITDALSEMDEMNFGAARETLKQAQLTAEAIFIDYEDRTRGGDVPSP